MAKYKEILTIDQLLSFCEQQKFQHFSSAESGYQLAVKIPTVFEEVENIDDNHRGMMKLKFRIFHTGLNRNGSFVSESSAKKAMKTIADRPVLAAIHKLDDGTWDFEGHEMKMVENENGECELEYIESQVGSFSSEPAFWEHDDDLNKDYVCAYAYISEEYTKTAEIIRRKNGTKNSCELFINELSYNAKEKYLELIDFFVNGSTLLGSHADGEEIGEGMVGSRADIADFSVENNSVKFNTDQKLFEIMRELKESLDNYTKAFSANDNARKGGTEVKFEELLEKYDKTLEDITFDYEGLSDEELEAAFADAFAEGESEEKPEEDASEENPENEGEPEEKITDQDDTNDDSESEDENENYSSFSINDGVKNYSISLGDKINALSTLVNDTYSELDNDYYFVDVYEEDEYVLMHGWTKSYKQSFKKKKDNYSLIGDRVPVKAQYLTDDEIKELEVMRSRFSEVTNKLQKYEDEPKKAEILSSKKYGYIYDTEEFTTLMENHFDMSLEDVSKKADEILLSYAESGKLKFAEGNSTGTKSPMRLPIVEKNANRYGTLFAE